MGLVEKDKDLQRKGKDILYIILSFMIGVGVHAILSYLENMLLLSSCFLFM